MCGISGFYSLNDHSLDLKSSLNKIQHRGPDSTGFKLMNYNNLYKIGLGHNRLSVLDLSENGRQPMISDDGKITMVFNGEIYNHSDLRKRLIGYSFKSSSDSEVLLEYYRQFGTDGFSDLRGMFAAVFYESDTGNLILLRDQIGVKPIYFAKNESGFYFSSEIKGILPFIGEALNLDCDALFDFLSCGFVYEPYTGLKNIQKIPSGCFAVINSCNILIKKYFDIEAETRESEYSSSLIARSINRQLESDAKLGVFYSGGLDSSVIAAHAQKPSLFAQYEQNDVEYSGLENDGPYAEAIAERLKLELSTVPIGFDHSDAESILKSMRAVAVGTEELISDYTYFASAELARVARAEGFKVMLSGMGGDEVFVGYPRYRLFIRDALFRGLGKTVQWAWLRSMLRRIPSIAKKVDRFAQFYSEKQFALRYARLLGYFSQQELRDLLGDAEYDRRASSFVERSNGFLKGFEGDPPLIRAMILDFYGFLSHNLMVADKSSMSVGLELRVPFLDQDLYCSYLGALRSGGEPLVFGKQPLKRLLSSLLPRVLVNRRKTGFNPPLDSKVKTLGEARILKVFRSGLIGSLLNLPAVEDIVSRHFDGTENNSYKIWQLLYLSFWLDEHQIT